MTSSAGDILVRNPSEGEREAVRALWEHAFCEDSRAFVDWYFAEIYRPGNTLGLYERGQPRAFLQMNPYTLRILGRDVPAAAVAGVSTWREHRRRGFAARLLRDSLAAMRDRGAAAAFLYPFDPRFYRAFGYETVMARKRYEMETARLPAPAGEGRAVPAGVEWAGRLLEAYREFAAPYACRVVRDRETMARRLREHEAEYGSGTAWLRGARVCGYLLGHREEDAFVADEWAARDADALAGLLAHGAAGGPARIRWFGPRDDRFPMDRFPCRVQTLPFTMMRIVDFRRLIDGAPSGARIEPLRCRVEDADCPWNQGVWRVGARDGRLFAEAADEPADVRADISALAPLVAGTAGPEKADGGGAAERLSALFPLRSAFMWEMY